MDLDRSINRRRGGEITITVNDNWYHDQYLNERSVLFLTQEQKKHLQVESLSFAGIILDEISGGWFYPAKIGGVATLPPRIEIRMSDPSKWRDALELICSVSNFPVGSSLVLRILKNVTEAGEPVYLLEGDPPQS